MSDTYRVYCPDHGAGTTVDSAFVARQLSKHHNVEYGCDSEWKSVDTGADQ